MQNRIALITGSTSGIGEATARLLADHKFRLIICGRRKNRLEALTRELSLKTEVISLAYDVSKRSEVDTALESLTDEWRKVDVLINNAGNAHGLDPVQSGNVDDWEAMIDINVKGLLYVTRKVVPWMTARQQGHVINIGSIAGLEVYANGNVYCASKSAVEAFTRAIRLDLNPFNIKVTGIHPGLVETEFSLVRFKGDEQRAGNVYKGMKPLTGKDIADLILYVLTVPPHVVLADITVFPTAQASATTVKRT